MTAARLQEFKYPLRHLVQEMKKWKKFHKATKLNNWKKNIGEYNESLFTDSNAWEVNTVMSRETKPWMTQHHIVDIVKSSSYASNVNFWTFDNDKEREPEIRLYRNIAISKTLH